MKKQAYMTPMVEIVKIETLQMMAASVGFGADIDSAAGAEAPEMPLTPEEILGLPSLPF